MLLAGGAVNVRVLSLRPISPTKSRCRVKPVVCNVESGLISAGYTPYKTLGGATERSEKTFSSVFTVALISGSGQVDGAKDLWERNLGAIVVVRRRVYS